MSDRLFRRGEYRSAEDALCEALTIFRDIGDLRGELSATASLGNCCLWSGRCAEAARWLERALVVAEQLGIRTYVARALAYLGRAYNEQGRHDRALACCERALTLTREMALLDQGLASVHLGRALHGLGRHSEATEQLCRALELTERLGADEWHGLALMYLGDVEHDLGLAETAVRRWQEAHRAFDGISHVLAGQAAQRMARST